MAEVWLCTIQDVRNICGLPDSVENERFFSARDRAHKRVQKILGTTGYGQILDAIEADSTLSGPANAVWKNLLDGNNTERSSLKKLVARLIHFLSINDLYARTTKTGIQTKSGQDFSPVDPATLGRMYAEARDAYEVEQELLLTHIQNNLSTYTWYSTSNPGEERIGQKKGGGGFVFPPKVDPRTQHYGIPAQEEDTHQKYING